MRSTSFSIVSYSFDCLGSASPRPPAHNAFELFDNFILLQDCTALFCVMLCAGMNAAVRAIVRMGIYCGCRVYFIKEVRWARAEPTSSLHNGPALGRGAARRGVSCSLIAFTVLYRSKSTQLFRTSRQLTSIVYVMYLQRSTRRAGLQRPRRGRLEHRRSHLGNRQRDYAARMLWWLHLEKFKRHYLTSSIPILLKIMTI